MASQPSNSSIVDITLTATNDFTQPTTVGWNAIPVYFTRYYINDDYTAENTMYGNADYLVGFKLMPLEPQFVKPIEAQWSFQVVDMARRLVAFKDESVGKITSWKWDFGDGETSTEQNPVHAYKQADHYVVVLWVEGLAGKSRRAKVWDVAVK